ncbi:galanin receptor type 1-like [Stylophora pistillata]|uniref:galanin receptor type 1-like n=1 Tax=Stylophora pistillata TaxID=50429 RepID=UPI000C051741|nr:galanin receptor type 1-like [Stylophora pistillata]
MSTNYTETRVNGSGDSVLYCVPKPTTFSTQVGLTIAYFIVFLVALVGNSMIIFVIHRHPKCRTTFNMLIVNMATADILDVITAIPLSLVYLYESAKWFPGNFGIFLCKFLPFLAFISIGSSVLTLTVMTFDRYLAIVHLMKRPLSFKLTIVAITLTWLISSLVFSSELYKYKLYNESGQVICGPRWVDDLLASHKISLYEMIARFVLFYLIPLLAMAVLYSKIVLHMWRRKAPGEHIDKNQKRIERQKRKVISMLVTIVILFALCWLPAHVNHFLLTFNFGAFSCLPTSLILTFFFLTHANTAINPCLYFIFNEIFREGFKHQIYHRLSGRLSNGSDRLSFTRAEAISGSATASRITLLGSKQGSTMEDRYHESDTVV